MKSLKIEMSNWFISYFLHEVEIFSSKFDCLFRVKLRAYAIAKALCFFADLAEIKEMKSVMFF